jgi:hypothetical protein
MARSRRPVADDVPTLETQRLNVQIGVDEYQRLMIHCVMLKRSPGEVLTELVAQNLREFRVQRNSSGRVVNSDRAVESGGARETAAA